MFLQIGRGADPVDHRKQARGVQRRQNTVPCASVQIDALRAIGQKRARGGLRVCGNDNQKRMRRHRDEGLRAIGVAFDQIEFVGKPARLGLKERNASPGVAKIKPRKIMVAFAHPCVDQPTIAADLQHIAEGGEGSGSQEFGAQMGHLQGVVAQGAKDSSLKLFPER